MVARGARTRLIVVAAAIAAIIAAGIVATVVSRHVGSVAGGAVAIDGGSDRCGTWSAPHAGLVTFRVSNSAVTPMDAYLEDPRDGKVYAELEGEGAAAAADVRVVLGDGRYRFVCLVSDQSPVFGTTFEVTGAARGLDTTPGIVPVTAQDLASAVSQYAGWIQQQIPGVLADAQDLVGAVGSGDLAGSRDRWVTAHMAYTRLGGAYGTAGDAGDAVDDAFAALERDLWGAGAPTAVTGDDAAGLVDAITKLRDTFRISQFAPLDLGLRAHEITEDELRDQLSGTADALSGTGLATVDAGVDATREALVVLEPVLTARGYDLEAARAGLDRLQALVEAQHVGGWWTPVTELDQAHREAIDAVVSQNAETLAPIAAITDIRQAVQP